MQASTSGIRNYAALIRGVARHAPKLTENPQEEDSPERGYLLAMALEVETGGPALLSESRSYLRCILREYRDESARYLANLRREWEATSGTLQDITRTMAESDEEGNAQVGAALERLDQLAASPPARPVAKLIRSATGNLASSLAGMRKQQQLILSQLQAEVRLLTKRMNGLTASTLDDLDKLMPRDEMEHHIALDAPGTFRLLLFKVDGLSRARAELTPEVFSDLSAAFARRMRNNLPARTAASRWSEEGFVALLRTDIDQARELASTLQKLLSGPYVCRAGPKTIVTRLRTTVEVLGGDIGF